MTITIAAKQSVVDQAVTVQNFQVVGQNGVELMRVNRIMKVRMRTAPRAEPDA